MRLLPGAVFGVCFGILSQVFFRGSVVALLLSVGAGVMAGEMVFESDE